VFRTEVSEVFFSQSTDEECSGDDGVLGQLTIQGQSQKQTLIIADLMFRCT
jgi:hypothetical protein